MLRFGPSDGPVVMMVPALFEEANRTRALTVAILRHLADEGIAALLPDLPGTGESLTSLEDITADVWPKALLSAIGDRQCHLAGIRGGCLIAGNVPARSHWYFAPAPGTSLVRDLIRTAQAAAREQGAAFDEHMLEGDGPPVEIAGNRLPPALLRTLAATEVDLAPPARIVRLNSDRADADQYVDGAPLWRRAEPDTDHALAAALAHDLAAWIRRCES